MRTRPAFDKGGARRKQEHSGYLGGSGVRARNNSRNGLSLALRVMPRYAETMTDHATKVLDRYLDPASPSHGALMISGAWGSGKTHFVKEYFRRRNEAQQKREPLKGPAHLYATLNGVGSADDISEQFWAAANPALSSKLAQALGAAAISGVQIASRGQALRGDNAKAVRNFLSRPISGYPLVFDDLERSQIPLPQVMGLISDFVEQHGAKVVILANEAEIEREPEVWKAYSRQKEKLVAKTIEVTPDVGQIFRAMACALPDPRANSTATKNEERAIAAFEASGHRNLRSLRAALDDFDRLVSTSGELLSENDALLEQALPYVIATGMELRAGTLQPSEVAEVGTAQLMEAIESNSPDPSRDRLALIANKYAVVDFLTPVVPPKVIARLYSSGFVERDELNNHLKEHPLYLGSATPSWKRLWRWFETPIPLYKKIRLQFLDDLTKYNILEVGPILHSAGVVLNLRKSGDDLLDGADILQWFTSYLDHLVENGLLLTGSEDLEWQLDTSFDGLGYQSKDDPAFGAIRTAIIAATQRARERHVISQIPELLDALRTGETERLYEHGFGDPNLGSLPALHLVDVADFKAIALQDGVVNRQLMSSLHARYHRSYRPALIQAERTWVETLLGRLEQDAEKLPPPHRQHVLDDVDYYRNRLTSALAVPPNSTDFG